MNGVIIQYTRYFAVVSWHALADLTTLTESKRESAIANFRVGYPHTPPNSLLLSGRMSTVAPSTPKRDGKAKLAAESPDSVTTSTMSDMSSEPEASLGVVPTKKGISGPSHALSGLGSGLGIMRGGLFSGAAALVAAPVVGVQKGVEAGGGEKKSTGGERSLQPYFISSCVTHASQFPFDLPMCHATPAHVPMHHSRRHLGRASGWHRWFGRGRRRARARDCGRRRWWHARLCAGTD